MAFIYYFLLAVSLLLFLLSCLLSPFLLLLERRDFVGQESEALPGEQVNCKEEGNEAILSTNPYKHIPWINVFIFSNIYATCTLNLIKHNDLRHAQPRFKAQYPTLHPTCTAKEIARDPATVTNADPRLAPTSSSGGGATNGGSSGQRPSPVIGSLEKNIYIYTRWNNKPVILVNLTWLTAHGTTRAWDHIKYIT